MASICLVCTIHPQDQKEKKKITVSIFGNPDFSSGTQGCQVSCTKNSDLPQTYHDLLGPCVSYWQHLRQQAGSCCLILSLQGLEDTLLPNFLEDISIQYLKSVRLFSKRFKLWLLSALEGFPAILQISKLKGRVPHKTQILQDEALNVATRAAPSTGGSYTVTLCP